MIYFYTYGFNSSLGCNTFINLKQGLDITPIELEYYNNGLFMDNIELLTKQIKEHIHQYGIESFAFIGNSLGAFYLSQIASFAIQDDYYPKPLACFLFNPVNNPLLQLKKYIGRNHNTTTNQTFDFTQEAFDSYQCYLSPHGESEESISRFVFIALEDELINANDSIAYWQHTAQVHTFHGRHKIYDFTPFKSIIHGFHP